MEKKLKGLQALFGLAILGVIASFSMSIVTVVKQNHAKEEAKLRPVALPAMGMPGNS